MRRVFVFIIGKSYRKMKRPEIPPHGEPGPAHQKARLVVWPRHQWWVVAESDELELAASAPAATTTMVVVNTPAVPAAAPAPVAEPPAVSACAKTPDEKAAIIKPRASFFIVAPAHSPNT